MSSQRLHFALVTVLVLGSGVAQESRQATAASSGQRTSESALRPVNAGGGARSFSGIYPHLASFNERNECGIGALVPWADRLWWATYAPHEPDGSDDRLYATNAALDLFVAPASIGGTPANRMIHAESEQLFIGPYAIDRTGRVRVIPYSRMRGRLTGNARHLTDAANKIYYATMEEGFYEVDVHTLAVNTLFTDTQDGSRSTEAGLPGYHGKGLYSGQGVLVYANNGEPGELAQSRPDITSGVLAEWDGEPSQAGWRVVQRNQFTEVTGPGGIRGNPDPAADPLWSVGWDQRSLLLMLRTAKDAGSAPWQRFRLPKASHCYDGAHGWNTEWPRIRDIGEDDLLMTMHGTLWRFPRTFDRGACRGIEPRSTHLKVIGDFCRYEDRVVFGCDDAARSAFLNRRRAKGELAGPETSQSNLWFVRPAEIDALGPVIGRGGVFVDDPLAADTWSDPFLFAGYDRRVVHVAHDAGRDVTFRFETDAGDGRWEGLTALQVGASGYAFHAFEPSAHGAWIRVAADAPCRATVWFEYSDADERTASPAPRFRSLAGVSGASVGGLVRAGSRERGLQILATAFDGESSRPVGYYELRSDLSWGHVEPGPRAARAKWMLENVAIPKGVVRREGDSMLYVDDEGHRWRLPIGNAELAGNVVLSNLQRCAREVVTERDLFQCAGTFFELPARNAGGFRKLRPIATHPYVVQDYCSWRGLLVMTGLQRAQEGADDPHVVRSEDGRCAVWLGAVDDLWQLGKPRGRGGPWTETGVRRGVPSDPFLMAGYDRKSVSLSHDAPAAVSFSLELDFNGTGSWRRFRTLEVPAGEGLELAFPEAFAAYWIRLVVDRDCTASARFEYR